MKPTETLQRLLDVYAEKARLRQRHVAAAAAIGQYDVNNTYQYVIAREDQHLTWLADAIGDAGAAVPGDAPAESLAAAKSDEALRQLTKADGDALDAFVAAWQPRLASMTQARHKLMLELMLGEMREQARLFHQAAAGQLDLLGRRTGGARMPGTVLPTRWVE